MRDFDKIGKLSEDRNIKFRQYLYSVNFIGSFFPCVWLSRKP